MSEIGSISVTVQNFVLACLLQNVYVLALCKPHLKVSYFTEPLLKIICKSLLIYFEEYQKLPNEKELKLTASEYCSIYGVELTDMENKVDDLYNHPKSEESFIIKKVEEFIKSSGIYEVLVDELQPGKNISPEGIGKRITDSMEITLTEGEVYRLSDKEALDKYRIIVDERHIIKSSIDAINQVSGYRGYPKGSVNMIVSAPGTGKTSFLVCEGAYAAQQFKYVLHIFLGDMLQYDGIVKYCACLGGIDQTTLLNMNKAEQDAVIDDIEATLDHALSRVDVLVYSAEELTMEQLIGIIKRNQTKYNVQYDMIIIDYADNLAPGAETLYLSGGHIYNKLNWLARHNNSVIMVASQPKIGSWREEHLQMDSASESAKKQAIVDMMLTLGMVVPKANVGTLKVAKIRRGIGGTEIRVKTELELCRIHQIDEDEYYALKAEYDVVLKQMETWKKNRKH